MALTFPLVLFAWVTALVILGLFVFYDSRSARKYRHLRRQGAFHCVKCDHLYAAARDDGLHPCPRCRHPNARLRY